MIYPENTIDKLGFAEIRERVRQKCLSQAARDLVERMQPLYKHQQIDLFLQQTHEFKEVLVNDSPLVMEQLFPIKPYAEKIRLEGAFLLEQEFHELRHSIQLAFRVLAYFKERRGLYPALEILFQELSIEKDLGTSIDRVIDDKGHIRGNASPLLADLTAAIAKAEQEARRKLDQVFQQAQGQGWVADGNLTVRDGRLCIPILAENKRKLKGFVHDESASGQTAYIEPEEVFHLNNKVRDLEFERRREIIRILIDLTDRLRPQVPLLLAYHSMLTKVDFIRAKALFAIEIEAHRPILLKEPMQNLVNAEHPLLKLSLKQKGVSVVPLNIRLDETDRVIVVSGPNAGGKSVCLKTVGLLQLMAQAGLLIPADPSSQVGVFRAFFTDIGDSQSIESDLSTYSAHLTKMKYFTEHADNRSLILIDEFGTGTDPQFGGPMAESVLEALNRKKVKGVVTTHYSNLKVFAGNTLGLQNASMLFDNQAMRPLYILQIGKPGSSYAFEIAQKIGLDPKILESARQKVGKQQKHVDTLLVDLEREKASIMQAKAEFEKREAAFLRQKQETEQLQSHLDQHKQAILKQAKADAKLIILQANKLIENTISEIREKEAEKASTKALRERLKEESERLEQEMGHSSTNKVAQSGTESNSVGPIAGKSTSKASKVDSDKPLQVGDWVRIKDSGAEAQVLEVGKNNLVLALGELRTVQKLKNVERISRAESKRIQKATSRASRGLSRDLSNFSPEIDVRGMRTESALNEIEKVLDEAIILGYPNLRIVHGKGDGILRRFIRDYLRKYSQISHFEDEHPDRGGDGITYAYLS